MSDASTHDAIRARLAQVGAELDRYADLMKFLGVERAELETALRVFERFDVDDARALSMPVSEPPVARPAAKAPKARKGHRKKTVVFAKPRGLPTMNEMVLKVFEGLNGEEVEPKEILAAIRMRWWPETPSASVGPTMWRMWKEQGLLVKNDDGLYSLPKTETPAGETAGASEPGGRSGPLFENPVP